MREDWLSVACLATAWVRGRWARIGLLSVACLLAVCVGLGSGVIGARADAHASWRISSLPSPATKNTLGVAVSCGPRCIAVGGGARGVLAYVLKRSGWSRMAVPNPSHVRHPFDKPIFSAVSCSSARACMAVGSDACDGAFAEGWDGHSWRQEALARGTGNRCSFRIELNGVSCVSRTFCLAAGDSAGNSARRAMERSALGSVPGPKGRLRDAVQRLVHLASRVRGGRQYTDRSAHRVVERSTLGNDADRSQRRSPDVHSQRGGLPVEAELHSGRR